VCLERLPLALRRCAARQPLQPSPLLRRRPPVCACGGAGVWEGVGVRGCRGRGSASVEGSVRVWGVENSVGAGVLGVN